MPVSPGASGMQPRDPCRPWRGTLASGHKPRGGLLALPSLESNPQLSFATRMEDWTCLGQHKRQPEFPVVTRESRRNSRKTTWLPRHRKMKPFPATAPQEARDGSVKALVGGFDFQRSKFNHATQAYRQPGSSFKPFIYSAALERGYSPASVVDDAPISFPAGVTGGQPWEPKNYDDKYDGPISLRTALAKSKNMVSIRLLQSIGPRYAQDYVTRFGIPAEHNPAYLTMALGAGSVTPWEMASAYAVFANGGYRVQPYVVKEIIDGDGQVVARTDPPAAGESAARVVDPRNVYLMESMMQDVVRRGTATRALVLNRSDLAGKTGTTNDYLDAWFCGFNPEQVAVAWIGFDQPRNMGRSEEHTSELQSPLNLVCRLLREK